MEEVDRPVAASSASRSRFYTLALQLGAEVPSVFEAYIGNGREGFYGVQWDGEALIWSFKERGREDTERFHPTRRQWLSFWRLADEIDVWSWRESYACPDILDGTSWRVTLGHGEKSVKSSGANAYPPAGGGPWSATPDFDRFCRRVSRLVGGRTFA